ERRAPRAAKKPAMPGNRPRRHPALRVTETLEQNTCHGRKTAETSGIRMVPTDETTGRENPEPFPTQAFQIGTTDPPQGAVAWVHTRRVSPAPSRSTRSTAGFPIRRVKTRVPALGPCGLRRLR